MTFTARQRVTWAVVPSIVHEGSVVRVTADRVIVRSESGLLWHLSHDDAKRLLRSA